MQQIVNIKEIKKEQLIGQTEKGKIIIWSKYCLNKTYFYKQ